MFLLPLSCGPSEHSVLVTSHLKGVMVAHAIHAILRNGARGRREPFGKHDISGLSMVKVKSDSCCCLQQCGSLQGQLEPDAPLPLRTPRLWQNHPPVSTLYARHSNSSFEIPGRESCVYLERGRQARCEGIGI